MVAEKSPFYRLEIFPRADQLRRQTDFLSFVVYSKECPIGKLGLQPTVFLRGAKYYSKLS